MNTQTSCKPSNVYRILVTFLCPRVSLHRRDHRRGRYPPHVETLCSLSRHWLQRLDHQQVITHLLLPKRLLSLGPLNHPTNCQRYQRLLSVLPSPGPNMIQRPGDYCHQDLSLWFIWALYRHYLQGLPQLGIHLPIPLGTLSLQLCLLVMLVLQ